MAGQLPSGFRDLDPTVAKIYENVIDVIREIFRNYGFKPLYTPHLELWDVLKGKYGEEAENMLIWRFQDYWSKDWYALRYDHTVPLVRHFVSKKYPLPFKRYTVGSVFRHERPQRGRFREFIQADADIIGSPFPEADAELINLIADVMDRLGFEGKYVIKLNDRRIVEGVLKEHLGVKEIIKSFRIIDKLDKIGIEGVRKELRQFLGEKIAGAIINIINAFRGEVTDILSKLSEEFGAISAVEEGINFICEIYDLLSSRAKKHVRFSIDLVRGLDYYTGPIWEIIIPDANLGSVGGGGRYDNLIGLYTKNQIPATGTSFGVDRLVEAGLSLGLYKDWSHENIVCIIVITREVFKYAWNLANDLRNEGIPVILDLMRRKLSKQKEYAKKFGARILIYLGKKEIERKILSVYLDNKHYEVDMNKIIKFLKERL